MDFVRGLERLFLASGVPLPTCTCAAEKVTTEICLSTEDEVSEDTNNSLREVSLEYSWSEVVHATGSFSPTRIIGKGRLGTVYTGRLEEGMDVAVKNLDEPFGRSLQDEVRLLSRCHHPNVVILLGFSCDTYQGRHALVYELLGGGSVFTRLHMSGGRPFGWEHRLQTGIQISRAMAHLHRLRPEVFHRDLKSSAILLTSVGVAKLADFQFACNAKNRLQHLYSGISLGTPGYSAPEYLESGYATEASEIYAMAVVLVELLTGRMPTSQHPDGLSCASLIDSVRPEVERASDRLLSLLDPVAQWPKETAAGMAAFVFQSLHHCPEKRPNFLEMVTVLQHIAEIAGQIQSEAVAGASPRPAAKPALVKVLASLESPQRQRAAESSAAAACAASYAAAAVAGDTQPGAATTVQAAPPLFPECQQLPALSEGLPFPLNEDTTAPPQATSSDPWEAAAVAGPSAGGAFETACPLSKPKLDDRPLSADGELAGGRVPSAPASPGLASGAARGFAEAEQPSEQPPAAKAKTMPSLAAQRPREAEEETAPLLQEEPGAGAGPAAEPPKSWLQSLGRRSLGSNPDTASSEELQTGAEAVQADPPPLILTDEMSALLSAGEPSPSQGAAADAEAEVRGEGGARQWLRSWNWPRQGAAQGDGQGEAEPPQGRWDIRDKAEAAMARWEIRDKAEAVMSRLDPRGKGDPENPIEPRRWLQSWIRPPTPSTQASGQDAANSKAEDDTSSGAEASSEDEGERRRWLAPWRRPPQLSLAPAVSRRTAMVEAKGDAADPPKPWAEASSFAVAVAVAAPEEPPAAAQPDAGRAAEAPGADGLSPNHAAIGRLFHISDLVE